MFAKSRAPHKDTGVILKEAAGRLDMPTRRVFLRNAIGLGSLTLLSGCDVVDGFSAERMLQSVSDFNDRVQALLFDPNKLAPEYPESAITRPFPFNAFYSEDKAPVIDPGDFHLDITGLAENQEAVDPRRALCAAEVHPDHKAYLHRGMERHRQMDRRPLLGFLDADRGRHQRQICDLPLR